MSDSAASVPPVDLDASLWAATRTWANANHIGVTKITAGALKSWAKAKGYS